MRVAFSTDYQGVVGMMSYPEQWAKDLEWREVEPFITVMTVVGRYRGRSAAGFVLKDAKSGITYPLFMTDILAVLQTCDIHEGEIVSPFDHSPLTWEPCKRGQNYGIRLAKK